MLTPIPHKHFDRFDIWLTPFEVDFGFMSLCRRPTIIIRLQNRGNVIPGKYKLNCAVHYWQNYLHHSVTFRTHTFPDGKKIEPPSPRLIALHAACAQIAHMSGAAEYLEETFRDTEPIPVMTATPNAAGELVHALKKVQLQCLARPSHVQAA